MSQVLDYSSARPGGAAIAAAGYVGVMRYLSFDVTKNLDALELADLQAHGLSIGLVWETTATRALRGRAAGRWDATEALRQARGLGYPESCALYFAVDFDTSPGDQPAIDDYFRGCADVVGLGRLGVYGSFYVVERCFASGVVSYGWQTLAWSGGQISAHAALYQNGSKAFGQDADVNDVRGPYGSWGGTMAIDPGMVAHIDGTVDATYNALRFGSVQGDPPWFFAAILNQLNGDEQALATALQQAYATLAAVKVELDDLKAGPGDPATAAAVARIEKAMQSA